MNGSPCLIIISANSSIISINSLFIDLPFGDGFISLLFVSSILTGEILTGEILTGDFDLLLDFDTKFIGDFDLLFDFETVFDLLFDFEILFDLEGNLSTNLSFFDIFSAFFLVIFFKLPFDLLFDLLLDLLFLSQYPYVFNVPLSVTEVAHIFPLSVSKHSLLSFH